MTRNEAKILEGLRHLCSQSYELLSGKVTAVDEDNKTMTVQPTDGGAPMEGVLLCTHTPNEEGFVVFPKEGSNVVIASVDGPGQWCLIRSSEITKAKIKIKDVVYEMDESLVSIKNKEVVLSVTDSVVKITTQNESLFKLLKDCFTYIMSLTVPTPAGTSSPPVNASDFSNLITRLNNLLNE